MLFIISGPSGCGKSTLVKRVLEEMGDVDFSVSFTTRNKRENESNGKDYYFIDRAEFEDMIEKDKFLEYAVVHKEYYGSAKKEVERKSSRKDLLLDVDVQGAHQIKEKMKKAVFIFILPPVFEELRIRLEKRGQESPESIKKRLKEAKKEIRHYPDFDYVIVNDDLEKALIKLKSIIVSVRCRLDVSQKSILPILRSFSDES
ncbi:MAG: guanylate kinase [Candidatus Aminicenantes bacterium]|nr:guanylate kinase [Candidatus Aminicenantes bacterium]